MSPRIIELPLHLKWSGPTRYDLDDPQDEQAVYEIVLREGGPADIRAYIDLARLRELWPQLYLPIRVRAAWDAWFARHHA
ncbi:hypothetical protein BH23ACT9_BH23ACT9_22380 [soil metagenome]